jgi:hypothetical protein
MAINSSLGVQAKVAVGSADFAGFGFSGDFRLDALRWRK